MEIYILLMNILKIIYKNLNSDLAHIDNNNDLCNHFINHGIQEGRLYKKNQIRNRKKYLQDYLNNLQLDFII